MIIDLDFENSSTLDEANHFLVSKQKADIGDAEAQYTVAKYYHKGLGVSQSLDKAFHYYQLAANQGHLQALVFTAFCYEHGDGVKQSYTKAFHYYQLAADQGNIGAQACLGNLYAEGKGTQQSDEKALHYYQLAAEQGSLLALRYLAEAYEKGLGVLPSQTKATFYSQQRLNHLKGKAATGNTTAQTLLKEFSESNVETSQGQEQVVYSIFNSLDNSMETKSDLLNNKSSQLNLFFRSILRSISNILNKYLRR